MSNAGHVRLFQVDSFTTTAYQGNPAGVVLEGDGLSDAQMQAIARECNLSETAFVLSPDAADHQVRVRFFTPSMEVPSCGHATIAAHYVRAREQGLVDGRVIQKIKAGVLPVDISRVEEGDYAVSMTQGAIEIGAPLEDGEQAAILAALGATAGDMEPGLPMVVASTGHSKVMIGLRTKALVDGLRPDFGRLAAISAKIGCNGFFPFTLEPVRPDVLSHGRMFAPAIGILEDPVTGNANGPLGAYLANLGFGPRDGTFSFTAMQGEACRRPGRMEVCVEKCDGTSRRVIITGRAVVVFEALIPIPSSAVRQV